MSVRPGAAAAVLIAVALALAGCFTAHIDLVIRPDGSVDGTMLWAYHRSDLPSVNLTPYEAQARVARELQRGVPGAVDCEPYADTKMVGQKCRLTHLSFEAANALQPFGHRLIFATNGDRYEVRGAIRVPEVEDNQRFDGTLSVTFPGKVDGPTTGEVTGRTVSWTIKPDGLTSIQASGLARSADLDIPSAKSVWPLVVIAAAVLALALLWARRHPAA